MKTLNQTNREECIDLCNKLLRGERSAVETYSQAIDKFRDEPALDELKTICADHEQSVRDLESNVRKMGGAPDKDSGAWGTFAKLVQKAANLCGAESAVEALEEGEEKGLDDYRKALESEFLLADCRELIRSTLIPRVQRHLATLDRIEESID